MNIPSTLSIQDIGPYELRKEAVSTIDESMTIFSLSM